MNISKLYRFKCLLSNPKQSFSNQIKLLSSLKDVLNSKLIYDDTKDPATYFFQEEVQNLMKTLTRIDLNKVYYQRKLGAKLLENPTYKFMTNEQLAEATENAEKQVMEIIQFPPAVKIRDDIDDVLSSDPAIVGFDNAKFVFTDITFGVDDVDRLITIRDTDGTLRKADWDTRARMNQIYFPRPGRSIRPPKMFQEEHLKALLEKKEYKFILDRACAQYEPDDPEYQRITSTSYLHIEASSDFDHLRSTRHFGPFVFFLAWFKKTDNLLLDLIQSKHLDEANALLELYYRIHEQGVDRNNLMEHYLKSSTKKDEIELALQRLRQEKSLASN